MEFNITFFEACEVLSRSTKTVGRYVRQGLLHPKKIKTSHGIEYRFSKADLDQFKVSQANPSQDMPGQAETGQDTTGQEIVPEIIVEEKGTVDTPSHDKTPLPETGHDIGMVPFLLDQIKVKDEQIKTMSGQMGEMIERDREKNILMQGLQNKVFQLEGGTHDTPGHPETGQEETPQKV